MGFALNYTHVTPTVCCLCKLPSWLIPVVSQERRLRLLMLLPLAEETLFTQEKGTYKI